jgi:photosystem II stability/assembly factor-like uncharacterized protein
MPVYPKNWSMIAPGGTVFNLCALSNGAIFLATESGLWRGGRGAWQPLDEPAPLAQTAALLVIPSVRSERAPLLLAAGAPASIAFSLDGGASWQDAHVDAIDSPVTCLVASPRFADDRVLLAGTAESGMLRSIDGGRYWRLANAGLQEFTVLALATAPAWNEREVAFAVTTGGIYRSPNGGRYWKRVAEYNEPMSLQALVVSPAFAEDGTVYAGGEATGIVRSTDGGRSWQPVLPGGVLAPSGINCLLMPAASILLAGTLDGAIYRSTDGGSDWECVATGHSSVLAFAASGTTLVAGLYEDGLLASIDQGKTWQIEPHLAVRDITRLAGGPAGTLLAFGSVGGVWQESVGSWERLAIPPDTLPLTALLSLPDERILAGTAEGLLALSLSGDLADAGLPSSSVVTALARGGENVWVGNAGGELWRSSDGGRQWERAATLAEGQPVTAVALENGAAGQTIAAATADLAAGRVTLWCSVDGGGSWVRWFEQSMIGTRISLCLGSRAADMPSSAAIGNRVWRWSRETWQPFDLDEHALVTLGWLGDGPELVAATSAGVYRCTDEANWERVDVALPPGGLLDLKVLPSGQMVGLGRGGWVSTITT